MRFIGELAGLSTSALWALTTIFFAEGGKRIGSFFVNKIRLVMATLLYASVLLVTTGAIFPVGLNDSQIIWLSVSGIVGLVFGDSCGFKALVMIGPRLTAIVFSSTPIITTLIAWLFLGESLRLLDLLGIGITVSGIAWVVSERKFRAQKLNNLATDHPDSGSLTKGVLYALGAAFGQAIGLVLAKYAMAEAGGVVEPLEAAYVRILASVLAIWLISGLRGQLKSVLKSLKNLPAVGFCAAGAVVGPFLGVWMSLVAVKYIPTGIASTLNSMTPVMVIPLVIWLYKEKVTARAWMGAVIALIGISVLFLT
ncbi:MAG: DMT family transporter [bacterium]|nr:DMT family transporter [bacterium]